MILASLKYTKAPLPEKGIQLLIKTVMFPNDWFIGEMKEHTYHLSSPLAHTHSSCAKMFYLVMDVLAGVKTGEEIQEEFKKCVANNKQQQEVVK